MTLDPTLAAADEGKTVDADLVPDQQYVQASDHLHPSTNDSVSDNDTSERPVREKLKKTSIASMPRTDVTSKPNDSKIQSVPGTKPDEPQQRGIPNDETPSPTSEPRGRLSRKRSFDDTIEVTGREYTDAHHDEEDATHARKRSRDVRATLPHATESPAASPERTSLERDLDSDKSDNDEVVDEGIENSAQSPRKKRSREEFEVDPQREQKIAATDEAKAYRRSEDSERGQLPPTDEKANFTVDSTVPEEQQPASEEPSAPQQVQSPRAEPSFEPSEPPSQKAPETANAEQKASQKAPTSFAASGFAAMANSSKSPFGTFGASNPSIFRSSSPLKNDLSGTASKSSDEPQKTHTAASTGFSNSPSPFLISATASTVASGFGFGANGAPPKPGAFSGSVFGSAFANKASAAPKLTSFAAPTGDLAPPKPAENARIFGTQAEESGEEDGGSDNEADPDGVASGDVEVDSRFQQREVETGEAGEEAIFTSSRAQLYYFDSGGWHEKGKGAFKLNVSEAGKEKKARFIMRAHQTFRVLLNQPVFKKMQVGDSKGKEPSGKTFGFAVIDQGRPTPHLLKLSDESEAKALYREVLRLQQDMETQA